MVSDLQQSPFRKSGVKDEFDDLKDSDDRKASLKDTAKKTQKNTKEKTPIIPAPDHPWRRWYSNRQ